MADCAGTVASHTSKHRERFRTIDSEHSPPDRCWNRLRRPKVPGQVLQDGRVEERQSADSARQCSLNAWQRNTIGSVPKRRAPQRL